MTLTAAVHCVLVHRTRYLLYIAPADAWYLPNGSAIPAPLRTVVYAPLALENALEEVRLACKCDFGRLHGYVAGAKATGAALAGLADVASASPR
jgi:hypothetical protein